MPLRRLRTLSRRLPLIAILGRPCRRESPEEADLGRRLAAILRDPDASSVIESDPFLRRYMESAEWGLHSWIPRPDKPEEFDEQEGFVNGRDRCPQP